MSKAGSLGASKMKPVAGNTGIKSGGANVPSTKAAQGQNGYGFAPAAKTNVPTSGGKGTGGKL
jgi:hypothetical protein